MCIRDRPSDEERWRHEFPHLPFKSWCAHCARGRVPDASRASVLHGADAAPEVAMGVCFLAKDGSDASVTVL
eukprot:14191135-Alexandrium_andersonii.AAC.1